MRNNNISKTLILYMVKQVGISIFIGFLFFVFLFLLNTVLLNAEELLQKNVPLPQVFLLIISNVPYSILLAAPFGTLIGTLISISNLSQNNEITAMQSLGYSPKAIFFPVLMLGILITMSSFLINDILLPIGAIHFKRIMADIAVTTPALELTSFSVKQDNRNNIVFITGEVTDTQVKDMIIFDRSNQGRRRLILSKEASFSRESEAGIALGLNLRDVISLEPHDKIRGNFESFRSDLMRYNIFLDDFAGDLGAPTPIEMTSRDLWALISDLKAEFNMDMERFQERLEGIKLEMQGNMYEMRDMIQGGTRRQENLERYLSPSLDKYRIEEERPPRNARIRQNELELFQKFALPFGVFTFVVFCFPLGLFNARNGWFINLLIAFGLALVYYFLLLFSRDLSRNQGWPPFLAVFLPNFLGLIGGGILFYLRRRH